MRTADYYPPTMTTPINCDGCRAATYPPLRGRLPQLCLFGRTEREGKVEAHYCMRYRRRLERRG